MTKRFGPTLGAGTVIEEKEVGKTIQPSSLGTTVFVGEMEKGETDRLLDPINQRGFINQCGTYFEGSELPDNAFDLFNFSNGTAKLYAVRVTDGNEVSSQREVWGSHPGGGEYLDRAAQSFQKRSMLRVTAKSGGRWGGRFAAKGLSYAYLSDLTETTLTTGITMLEDEYAGATLVLGGVSTKNYTVISNTTAGVLTVEGDSTMLTDLAADTPGNVYAHFYLPYESREVNAPGQIAGSQRGLTVRFTEPEDSSGVYFGLEVYRDEELVKAWKTLSLDPANKYYAENIVGADPDNPWVDVDVLYSGDYSDADARPYNFAGEYSDSSTVSSLTSAVVCRPRVVSQVTPANSIGYVGAFTVPSKCQRCTLRIEMTGATTFKVYATSGPVGIPDGELATGTVGTAYAPEVLSDLIPGFTVYAGDDAFQSGDLFEVVVDPFPVDPVTGVGLLSGSWFYYDLPNETRVQIESNTSNSITYRTALPALPTLNGKPSSVETTISNAVSFPTAAATQSLDLVVSNLGKVTVTAASSAYADIASLCAALNTAWQSGTGQTGNPFIPSTSVTDAIAVDSREIEFPSVPHGADAFWQSLAGSGTNDLNGLVTTTSDQGSRGDQWGLVGQSPLWGGYDGASPDDADYTAAFNTATSLINRLRGRNVGLIKIACPGVTSTAVQKAGAAYASFINGQYRIEVPTSVTTEASAKSYVNGTLGRNDYTVGAFPSYAYVTNPLGGGMVLQSLSGAIMGREAKIAADFQGYHKAAAGIDVTLPHVIKDVYGGRALDEELLNPVGLQVLKWNKGNYIVWGDRTLSSDPGWRWKHQRESMSHYERTLEENFDWIIFAINDPGTQVLAIASLRAYFLPEWQKRALRGATFDDAVTIKIDGENNTNLTRANGDLNADISLRLADTVERFIISIGKKGIFDQAA